MKLLKRFFWSLILFIIFLLPAKVFALNEVNLYLFWGNGCPHCEKEMDFLSQMESRYSNLKVYKYETWKNPSNKEHLKNVRALYGNENTGVPFTVIGDDFVSGFNDSRKEKIESLIRKYSTEDYEDKTGSYFNITHKTNLEGSLPPVVTDNNNNSSSLENESRDENTNLPSLDGDTEKAGLDEKIIATLILLILIIVLIPIYIFTRKKETVFRKRR